MLVEGETGTGKELVARAVHDASPRRRGPFVAVDCGALPEGLLESELFGHVRGAFTGAANARTGMLVRADGGTLFLDELGRDLADACRRACCACSRSASCARSAATPSARSTCASIAASRDDLDAEVAAGRFRPDLLYRLAVVRVALPPLRTRREDIPLLVARAAAPPRPRRRGARPGPSLDRLLAHGWPGNVRELRNVLDRAIALAPGAQRFADSRSASSRRRSPAKASRCAATCRTPRPRPRCSTTSSAATSPTCSRAHGGNLSAASRESGIDRKHLRTLARKHGLVDGPRRRRRLARAHDDRRDVVAAARLVRRIDKRAARGLRRQRRAAPRSPPASSTSDSPSLHSR